MKKYLEPGSTATGKRIYCVAANYVQAPLEYLEIDVPVPTDSGEFRGRPYTKLVRLPETRTIEQPAGRVMAQGEHVVSRVRDVMTKAEILVKLEAGSFHDEGVRAAIFDCYCEPITTINLLARDSFELNHVFELLKAAGVPVHDFHDFNQPDYGDVKYRVRTAIATEPVWPEQVLGILDYLPLWKPESQNL